jgi:plastocyanin
MPAPVAVPAPAPVTAPAPVGPGNPLTPVGPGPESITRPVEEPKAGTTVVKITDKGFEPAKVTIKVGETVEWQNESKSPQSVSADPKLAKKKSSVKLPKGATSFSSGDIARGATFSHEFATAGSYKYVSLRNESVSGSITVKEAEAKKETRKATKTTPKNTTTKKTIAKKSSKKASKPAPEHDPNL